MKDLTKRTIDDYVQHGYPPGGFVTAVLENNLKEAFARADNNNAIDMHEIVAYCYNHIPSSAWGSPEKVSAWLEREWEE
jgi:hypothetical protein